AKRVEETQPQLGGTLCQTPFPSVLLTWVAPLLPGIQKFRGRYLHSWEYKQPDTFAGKRVVVIGIGNSGADVAGEISRVAEQVFLSTRRGAWIWNRVWDDGNPMDTALFTRYNRTLQKLLPSFLINRWAEKKLNARFNHANYGLQAAH
ncbi:flavin-containing monooxygenase 5-like, partial [Marmota marmota marmota]|uniref:flavin-containing monooxygenase 5-like n=1 Tax=Marmota marmota marmota TaxID=9994 RepID=UPI002092756E